MSKISKDLYDKIWNILNEKQETEPAPTMTPEESKKYHEQLKKQREELEQKYVSYQSPEEKNAQERKDLGQYDTISMERKGGIRDQNKALLDKLKTPLKKTSTAEEMEQELETNGNYVERPKPEPAPQATQGLEQSKAGLQPKVQKVSDSKEPMAQPKATKFPPIIPSIDRPVNIPLTPTKPGDFGYIPPPSVRFPKTFKESIIASIRSKLNLIK